MHATVLLSRIAAARSDYRNFENNVATRRTTIIYKCKLLSQIQLSSNDVPFRQSKMDVNDCMQYTFNIIRIALKTYYAQRTSIIVNVISVEYL